jgi:transcriptional regulator with XRE-family HTH domain
MIGDVRLVVGTFEGPAMLQDLANRIRLQREKRGLKQHDIAHALQVSPQAVSKWERGENAPDIILLVPLAKLLGVSVDWLLGSYATRDLDVFEATVLVSGVQGARHKSEQLSPKDFAGWVNACCFQVTEAVLRHDGIPIKYNGPGILCFFSGANHGRRAIRAAIQARQGTAERLKIGIGTGQIYLGSIGHPDYKRPDVIGEPVSIALLAADWAAEHTAAGIACTACTLDATDEGSGGAPPAGKAVEANLPGIEHSVRLIEISL